MSKADPRYVRGTPEHAQYRRDEALAKIELLDEKIGRLMSQRVGWEEKAADWEKELARFKAAT